MSDGSNKYLEEQKKMHQRAAKDQENWSVEVQRNRTRRSQKIKLGQFARVRPIMKTRSR